MNFFYSITIWLITSVSIFGQSTDDPFKIVLIAGPNDHCSHESACHKYIQDLQVIKSCLEQQTGDFATEVELYIAVRPLIGSLDDADVVVIHSGADTSEEEWHALFPYAYGEDSYQDEAYLEWLNYFDQQMDRGMGLVVFHYATTVDHPESIKRYLKWVGGYYNEETSRVDGDLSTPGSTAIETVRFPSPEHPILNGVQPWTSEAEYYYKMDFGDQNQTVPLLTSALPVDDPNTEVIAWALERKDGGRGLGFTGCHNHYNLYMEDFRRFVLNSIMWTAGAKIPTDGTQSTITKRYFK